MGRAPPGPGPARRDRGDGVDFHLGSQREGGRLDGDPSRVRCARKMLCVHRVHAGKQTQVDQIHRRPQHLLQRGSSGLEQVGQIGDDLPRLGLDLAVQQAAGRGVDGDLAR